VEFYACAYDNDTGSNCDSLFLFCKPYGINFRVDPYDPTKEIPADGGQVGDDLGRSPDGPHGAQSVIGADYGVPVAVARATGAGSLGL